nr:hypothetical protein [Tanacetum cinerariifolium]
DVTGKELLKLGGLEAQARLYRVAHGKRRGERRGNNAHRGMLKPQPSREQLRNRGALRSAGGHVFDVPVRHELHGLYRFPELQEKPIEATLTLLSYYSIMRGQAHSGSAGGVAFFVRISRAANSSGVRRLSVSSFLHCLIPLGGKVRLGSPRAVAAKKPARQTGKGGPSCARVRVSPIVTCAMLPKASRATLLLSRRPPGRRTIGGALGDAVAAGEGVDFGHGDTPQLGEMGRWQGGVVLFQIEDLGGAIAGIHW